MDFNSLRQTATFDIFLSSGSDASALRDRLSSIVSMMNSELAFHTSLQLQVHRWEDVAPQKAPPQGTLNTIFIDMARQCKLTVVLLLTEIRQGTLEEVQAILAEPKSDLAVLWFRDPDTDDAESQLRTFLRENRAKFLYQELGPADSDAAWVGLFRTLLHVVVGHAYQQAGGLIYETR